MKYVTTGLFAAIATVAAASAMAAVPAIENGGPIVMAKVPFEFTVGKTTLPAGTYDIQERDDATLLLRNRDTTQVTPIMIVTRLAARGSNEVGLVFDETDDKSYLSEVHITWGDGFYLGGAPGKHTHVTIKAEKKPK